MPLFIMATRLTEDFVASLRIEEKEERLMQAIKDAKLDIKWLANYVITGPYDYIDVFTAPDEKTAMKLSTLVRTMGHAHTEIWGALEWKNFKEVLSELPEQQRKI